MLRYRKFLGANSMMRALISFVLYAFFPLCILESSSSLPSLEEEVHAGLSDAPVALSGELFLHDVEQIIHDQVVEISTPVKEQQEASFHPEREGKELSLDDSEKSEPVDMQPSINQSEENIYPVSRILLEYDTFHPEHLPLCELEFLQISLLSTSDGLFALSTFQQETGDRVSISICQINEENRVIWLSRSAMQEIMLRIYQYLIARGIDWVYLRVAPDQIAPDGADLRSKEDRGLTIFISIPSVGDSSVSFEDTEEALKAPHQLKQEKKICDHLPLSLPDPSTGYPGSFVDSAALNNYLNALNRHPGKRVDLEIGPTGIPGQVALDFVVSQEQPFHLYAVATNNVPDVIHCWQESLGLIHTQATGNDDILRIDYSMDSFDSYYSASASYEAPLGKRMDTRWKISGYQNRFLSAEFAIAENPFKGTEAMLAGEIATTIFQRRKLFVDLVAELQYLHIHNDKHLIFSSVTKNFLLPSLAVRAMELKRETKFLASLSLASTVSTLFWDVKKHLDNLGRPDLSPNWAIVQADLYGSFYLDSICNRIRHKPVTHLAHEFVFMGQLQNAFRQRLIPELEGILGGLYTVRGYPQSTAAGDNLYLGSAEYRFHLPQVLPIQPNACIRIFGKRLQWAPAKPKGTTDWDLIIRAFYDLGATTINQRKSKEENHVLMGTGLGAELVLWQNVFIRFDWGTALRHVLTIDKGHHKLYFSGSVIY